jgi:hypothetical protein
VFAQVELDVNIVSELTIHILDGTLLRSIGVGDFPVLKSFIVFPIS